MLQTGFLFEYVSAELSFFYYVVAELSSCPKVSVKKMNNFILLSLGITLALGIPDSELPLFDYESYDYVNNGIVTPLIGGESEFPAIENVSFFLFLFA